MYTKSKQERVFTRDAHDKHICYSPANTLVKFTRVNPIELIGVFMIYISTSEVKAILLEYMLLIISGCVYITLLE